jgi:hypothetical protein
LPCRSRSAVSSWASSRPWFERTVVPVSVGDELHGASFATPRRFRACRLPRPCAASHAARDVAPQHVLPSWP